MAQSTRTRITAQAYFQLPDYATHDLIQLIEGEVILSMPPILKHQLIVKKILSLLEKIEASNGGVAFPSPTEVKLSESDVYQPDVLYIAQGNMAIAQQDDKRIIGAPDLVVEVLSPSTAKLDRHQKYNAYEKNGVREYWIVDPLHETIEVWHRDEAEVFQRQGAFGAEDSFVSLVLETKIDVTPLFDV
ncbi:MAG: Uma2 family endonuclease [Chloroflexota bacterium]